MSKNTPTKTRYEEALDIVKRYEKRQADLTKLNKDLGFHLQQFNSIKFDVDESKKEITFAGTTKDGKLKLTKSVARLGDKFEVVIGKLICVLKALDQDVKFIDRYIEKDSLNITIDTSGISFLSDNNKGLKIGRSPWMY